MRRRAACYARSRPEPAPNCFYLVLSMMAEDSEDGSLFIAAGMSTITAVLLVFFSVYLSVRLGKKAWNTISKRFSRVLEIVVVLSYFISLFFTLACVLYGGQGCIMFFGSSYVYSLVITNFCIAISATALMLQVMFPWLSERKKRWLQSNAIIKCKLILEFLAVITIIGYNIFWITMLNFDIINVNILIWSLISFLSFILQIFSIICLLLFVCKTLHKYNNTEVKTLFTCYNCFAQLYNFHWAFYYIYIMPFQNRLLKPSV